MRKIAVSGGKGGVGKSVIAANIAISLAKKGRRTVLFDADLQLANIDVLLGISSPYNLQHVVNGDMSLAEIAALGPEGLRVITGGSAVQGLMNAGPKRMGTFIAQFDELKTSTDFLIFDTGAGLDNRVMTFLRLADQVVLVTTPDPTSVTDAYATCKVLIKKDPHAQIGVVVNEADSDEEARSVFAAFNGICTNFLGRQVQYFGAVRADHAVSESVRKRKPLMVNFEKSKAAFDILHLAETVDGSSFLRLAA
jgi:flagellar biosynthesis protein FlhG